MLAVLTATALTAYSQSVFIPAEDRVSDLVLELQARGYLRNLSAVERPWLISEIKNGISDEKNLFDSESNKLAQLILRIIEPSQNVESTNLSANLNFGVEVRGLFRENSEGYFYLRDKFVSRGYKNELGSIYNADFSVSQNDKWGLASRLIFDSDGENYPWYYGRAHNARIIGQFDYAYGYYKLEYLDIFFGRQRFDWGASPRGSLIIDDSAPPLDLLRLNLYLKPFRLTTFTSRLDNFYASPEREVVNRYLAGHRLSVSTGNGFEFAASEVVLYGGEDRPFELYYNIPIVLYYWESQNRKKDDNIFWVFDVSYSKRDLGRFYTQFVADDIQYEGNGPQKFAVQFGAHLFPAKLKGWSGLFEVNFVDTYVYGQRQFHNTYRYWNSTIGRLDSDQLEVFAGIYKRLFENYKIGVEYLRREKGEYDAIDTPPDLVPLNTEFPSGIVENINDIKILVELDRFERFQFGFAAGYQTIDNYKHLENSSLDQFYSNIRLSYNIDVGLPLWTKFH